MGGIVREHHPEGLKPYLRHPHISGGHSAASGRAARTPCIAAARTFSAAFSSRPAVCPQCEQRYTLSPSACCVRSPQA